MHKAKHVSTGLAHSCHLGQDRKVMNPKRHLVSLLFGLCSCAWPRIPKPVMLVAAWALNVHTSPATVLLSLAMFIIASWYSSSTSSWGTTSLILFHLSGMSSHWHGHDHLYPPNALSTQAHPAPYYLAWQIAGVADSCIHNNPWV